MTALFALAVAVPATVALTDAQRRRVMHVVRDAIQFSKQTMRQAAQEAEIDQAQFQRQIEMAEGSLKRLAMQPEAFWQWLGVTIAAEFGIPAEVQQATRLARASSATKRMARMEKAS